MPTFRKKNDKYAKTDNKNVETLDVKHTMFLKMFHEDETITIPKLKMEIKELKKRKSVEVFSIEELFKLDEEIREKINTIKKLITKKRKYYEDNSKIIFEYFENKKNIELSIPNKNAMDSKNKQIQSFFKMNVDNGLDDYKEYNSNIKSIYMKYLHNVDDKYIDVSKYMYSANVCNICKTGELVPYEDEGLFICKNCSHIFPYLAENEKPSYKETPKEICFYAYKRLNHFKEVLSQFQAKETTQINADIIDKIKKQIKKERITLDDLTNEIMREILRKLGYDSKYYEHIPFIKHKLGIKPLIMSRELEEDLYNDFNDLQAPYFKHCPNNRENFLNYNYTAYKLCERRGYNEFLPHFHMIKDRNKLIEHDTIWSKMCKDLDWKYIPTV